MRHALRSVLAVLCLALVAGVAEARPFDAKALARYDTSYVECEAGMPAMTGHRDEAYLHLWSITADEKSLARLAKLRTDPTYVAEKQRAAKMRTGASAPASGVVQRQCRGLWAEHQRAVSEKKHP